jgi:hypothetical protein
MRRTFSLLQKKSLEFEIRNAKKQVTIGGEYTHYKGGVYKVVGVAINENNQNIDVVYSRNKVWFTRPLKEWNETISHIDWNGVLPGMEICRKRFERK